MTELKQCSVFLYCIDGLYDEAVSLALTVNFFPNFSLLVTNLAFIFEWNDASLVFVVLFKFLVIRIAVLDRRRLSKGVCETDER